MWFPARTWRALLLAMSACAVDPEPPTQLDASLDAGARADAGNRDGAAPMDAGDGEVPVDANVGDSADAPSDASTPDATRADAEAGEDAEAGSPVGPLAWPAEGDFGPGPEVNPYAAPQALASQHGDTGASDSSPLAGPGIAGIATQHVTLFAVCPSVLVRSDGKPFVVCTKLDTQSPVAALLSEDGSQVLAELPLQSGQLFGGVYPYLDAADRLVVSDGYPDLLHVAAVETRDGFTLEVESRVSLRESVLPPCGGAEGCDGVVGLSPDYQGRIWFASGGGVVGFVEPSSGRVRSATLPAGERVANSIATAPAGTAVVSDHALYLWGVDANGEPAILYRSPYERGPSRKPGQLSYGSGSSPTFFGPVTGSDYVAITDNARPMHLRVLEATSGEEVCDLEIPTPAGDGSENSPVGSGRSVFVASTWGYPYPAVPEGAGESDPASADLGGGMTRIDVSPSGDGCEVVWSNDAISAAVPQLSVADALVYTMLRVPLFGSAASGLDSYAFAAIDAADGRVLFDEVIPGLSDTLQLAGTLANGNVFYQGTVTGVLRVTPQP